MRLSVSDLDQYRYWKNSDMELDALLRRLRRQEPPSPAMKAGTALHSLLEHSGDVELTERESEGILFSFQLDCEVSIPPFREVKLEKLYRVNGCDVTLVGMVDAMDAGTVYDHKLTARFDAENYMSAYQWRAYLDMFDCNRFVYNVFVGDDKGAFYRVHSFERLPLYRYERMRSDLVDMIGEFVDFARIHLPEKF